MTIPQHQGEKNRPVGYYMIYDQGVLSCQYQYLEQQEESQCYF